ncbi:MAG TPA: RNA polymerase sigma factor [Solirubrobacterales bacterium]
MAEARFARLYAEHSRQVMAYALRRTRREDAAEVVAETFLVAWRKSAQMPADGEVLLWLYGVARLVLANLDRGERRRGRLDDRLRLELPAAITARPEPDAERPAVMCALARLEKDDREVLLLAGWEELEPAQIAEVLAISAVATRSRLHRARRRLRKQLSEVEDVPDPNPTNRLEFEEAR